MGWSHALGGVVPHLSVRPATVWAMTVDSSSVEVGQADIVDDALVALDAIDALTSHPGEAAWAACDEQHAAPLTP
jgi:hypothetical protein